MRYYHRTNPQIPKTSRRSLLAVLLLLGLNLLPGDDVFAQSNGLITTDKLHGYVGNLLNTTIWSDNSRAGLKGDYVIDFGSGGGNGIVVTNGGFLNLAATNDIMSFALWIKKYDIAQGSAFWAIAPSAGGGRGWQAHVPWDNDNVYFDTDGCCDADGQRINQSISGFPPYDAIGDDSYWTNWHHFVFSKNGSDKQIWIDGLLFLEGINTNTLPTDFQTLILGAADPSGGGSLHALIDDFAVYATALTEEQITNLVNGTAPDALPASAQILAYWNFNDPPAIMPPVGSPIGFTIAVNDLGSTVEDTNTIVLSLNNSAVVPTSVTKKGSATTIAYNLPNPPFLSGSTQFTSLTIKDSGGTSRSGNGSFVVGRFGILTTNIALPAASVDKSKPGFKILTYQVDNPATGNGVQVAEDILSGSYGTNVANLSDAGGVDARGYFSWSNVINLDVDTTALDGNFHDPDYPQFPFPGIPGNVSVVSGTEHFACEFYTALEFPAAGLYTMVVNSDDDFRTTAGLNPADAFSAVVLGQFDDSGGRGASDTSFQFFVQQPGLYGFRTVYEQGGGGANIEWFMVNADGTRVLINDVTNSIKAYQWLPTIGAAYVKSTIPQPDATGAKPDAVRAVIVDGSNPIVPAQVSLKVDNLATAALVTKNGSETIVSYTPNPIFAANSSHTVSLSFMDGSTPVVVTWQFKVTVYAKDKVHSYVGLLQGAAAYTSASGGHSGKPGDSAMDFGTGSGSGVHIEHAADFLNLAAMNDAMSFSLWVKKYDIAASSAFWANSPTSNNGQRGWQAHTPWSDNTVYFDTAGCCGANTRLNASITTLPTYSGSIDWWKTNWHHFVFSKQGSTKTIWVDGQVLITADGYDPLPTDFTDMYLGCDGSGAANFMHGLIDDFAVYATALGTNEVNSLLSGTAPDALPASTQLLAYWDFNDSGSPIGGLPTSTIVKTGTQVLVTYTGVLQSSTSVSGPFTDVLGASSPYSVDLSKATQTFYRTRQ